MTPRTYFSRALIAGLATGCRSQSALAACALTAAHAPTTADRWGRLEAWAARPIVGRVALAAALGELIADKLPSIPSRTRPPSVAVRLSAGAVAGAVVSARGGCSPLAGALCGSLGSAATTFAGGRARAALTRRFGTDLPGALAEDVTALGLAAASVRAG